MPKPGFALAVATVFGLAACGGGGGGGGGSSTFDPIEELAALETLDPNPTREANLPSGAATYRGVANFNLSDPDEGTLRGYFGALSVRVDFGQDRLSGAVTDFEDYQRNAASGRIDIRDGRLTGTNRGGIGEGLAAVASGTIAGERLVMDVSGNLTGQRGEGLALYFDDRDTLRGGVGLAAR